MQSHVVRHETPRGVPGTLHHLYFAGTPTPVLALDASFSALEVVPLAYTGFEAYDQWRLSGGTPWMRRYKWPVMFFLAVAFWNLVGAGLFGFLINPPLSLYYMQGLNNGYWSARSAEFMQRPIVDLLVWLRVPGDTIFAIGALALALFIAMLWIPPRREVDEPEVAPRPAEPDDTSARPARRS